MSAADLDADGDADIIAGSWWDSKVIWYENNGGSPPSFTEHALGICGGPEALFAAQVDPDADIDILVGANTTGKVHFFENAGTIVAASDGSRAGFALHGVSPNPGRGALHVLFGLADRRPARIEVVDVAGRRVILREVGDLGPGQHQMELGSGLRAGIYLVRLTQGEQTRKMRAAVLE